MSTICVSFEIMVNKAMLNLSAVQHVHLWKDAANGKARRSLARRHRRHTGMDEGLYALKSCLAVQEGATGMKGAA